MLKTIKRKLMKTIEIELLKDISFQYIKSLRYHDDEIGIILIGHLFIEYIINKIIKRRFKDSNKILNNNRSYSFAVKLQFLYSSGYLPSYLFKNIKRINRIRNKLAHNLFFNLDKKDFKMNKSNGEEIQIELNKKRKLYPERYYCKLLCLGTLNQFREHYAIKFGELPSIPEMEF